MKTYCNPIPVPDYPIGRHALDDDNRGRVWRELADPTVLYESGVWYLYPSGIEPGVIDFTAFG